ncbi:hypothetical protein ACJRO7_022253 [Eucalyptus globulus]|uniref:Uncharacterized protein n=1 Tax=Eucalyptus globulus TaxID=34317 RepID=A0ABD3KP05_EUCGL
MILSLTADEVLPPRLLFYVDEASYVEIDNCEIENYDKLNETLARGDHSWTALTLKLCSSLEVANKLVQSTHGNAGLLLEKVEELEKIIKRGNSAVAAVKAITITSVGDGKPSTGSEHVK